MYTKAILSASLLVFQLWGCTPSAAPNPGRPTQSTPPVKKETGDSKEEQRLKQGNQIKAPKEGTVIHRVAAGEPGADGWCIAKSTEGLYTVQLPGPFHDFTVTARDEGVIVHSQIVTVKSKQGVRFMATAFRRAGGKFKQANLEAIVDGMGKPPGQKIIDRRKVTRGNIRGLEFKGINKSWVGIVRLMRTKDTDYMLVVEYPTNLRDAPTPATIDRFITLSSRRVSKKDRHNQCRVLSPVWACISEANSRADDSIIHIS